MKTLILCPGSYRSGTTWLYEYLTSYDNVAKTMKEPNTWITPALINQFPEYRRYVQNDTIAPQTLISDFTTYDWDFVTDISPSYSPVFEAEDYDRIKKYCTSIGVKVKLIFLIRHPIRKNISQRNARQKFTGGRLYPCETAELYGIDKIRLGLDGYMSSTERANRYDLIIPEIEKVFDEDERLYVIHEEMFTKESVERISNFVGLPYQSGWLNKKINHIPGVAQFSPGSHQVLRDRYRKSFEFCHDRFPQTKQLWS